jgi:molecular chaperone GrpE (heat shock protein)
MTEEKSPIHAVAGDPGDYLYFYLAGGVLIGMAILGFSLVFASIPGMASSVKIIALIISAVFVPLSMLFLVMPGVMRWKSRAWSAVSDLPDALKKVHETLTDVEVVRREHYRARTELERLHTKVQEEAARIEALERELSQRLLDTQKLDEALMHERMEKSRLNAQLKSWHEGAILFFQAIERALRSEGLDPTYRDALKKSLKDYSRIAAARGLDVIQPERNDLFDDAIHEGAGEVDTEDVEPGHIVECVQWGYCAGDSVMQRAKVIIARKPEPQPNRATDAATDGAGDAKDSESTDKDDPSVPEQS